MAYKLSKNVAVGNKLRIGKKWFTIKEITLEGYAEKIAKTRSLKNLLEVSLEEHLKGEK